MDGFGILISFAAAFVGLVMLLAQLKLFAIARTLENILGELQKQNRTQPGPGVLPEPQAETAAAAAATPPTPRTLLDRLGGKL